MRNILIGIALLTTLVCANSCGYTERTQARSAATIAQAESDARIAETQASVANMRTLADAAKPDNTVLLLVLLGVFGIGGMVIYFLMQAHLTHAQTMQAIVLAQLPQATYKALPEPPHYVQIAAKHWRGNAVHNGECWEIVDSSGRLLASERNQLEG